MLTRLAAATADPAAVLPAKVAVAAVVAEEAAAAAAAAAVAAAAAAAAALGEAVQAERAAMEVAAAAAKAKESELLVLHYSVQLFMPVDPQIPVSNTSDMHTKQLIVLGVVLAVALVGVGAWQWYLNGQLREQASHTEFYTSLNSQNSAFAQAENLMKQANFEGAIPLYQAALQSAKNDNQRVQILLLLARAEAFAGHTLQAIPHLKQAISSNSDPLSAQGRALAAEQIAIIYSSGEEGTAKEIFKDQPFSSMLVPGNGGLTVRHLHEFAASIYPIASAELRLAEWYSVLLPDPKALSKVKELVGLAEIDMAAMVSDATMAGDLREARLLHAIVVGNVVRHGDTSLGNADEEFADVIQAYADTGPGADGVARYFYALFLAQTYGADKKAEIHAALAPLSTAVYAKAPVTALLTNARFVQYFKAAPVLLAKFDLDFKAYLMTLGWTPSDFTS